MNLNGQQLRNLFALVIILAVSACSGDSSGPVEVEPSFTEGVVDGQLKIIKRVVNDNGGTATVAAFGVNTSAGALTFGAGVPDGPNTLAYQSQVITVTAGTSYTLRENDIAGYTEGTWTCEGATPTNNTITAGAVVAQPGIRVDCTITNDDVAAGGTLRIVKRVVNDNGGTATVAAFGVTSSAGALTFGAGVADGANTLAYSSQAISVATGSYTLRENDIAGYTEGTWTCTGATPSNNTISAGAVTVPSGGTVVCTITNDDLAGSLRIVKRVVNDNGGTAAVAAFGVNTSAGALTFGAGVADGASTLAYSSQAITVAAGSYTLRENDIAGYTEGTWTCTGATPSNATITAGAVTVPNGGTVVCSITNDDIAPSGQLKIIKRVVNDNGGTATVANFGVNTSAGALVFGAGVPDGANTLAYQSQILTVVPGSYTLRENDIPGYTEGTWTCEGATPSNNTITAGAVTVPAGIRVDCTITNDDVGPGSLRIVKRVVNDNGGTATVAAFGVTSSAGALTFGAGVADGANTLAYSSQTISVAPGSYTLRENDIAGYTEGTWTCTGATPTNATITAGAVTVPSGVAVVCTITNDDIAATGQLKIIKRVVNDNGGTATVAAFGVNTSAGALVFDGGTPDGANTIAYTSQVLTVTAGVSYTLRENDIAGYAEGTWSCVGATPTNNTISAGAVTAVAGIRVDCTITNNDIGDSTGQLKIIKRVVNNNGGTATVTAFGVNTSAGALVFDGGTPDGANTIAYTSQVLTVTGGVSYTLRENDIAGYIEGTWSCVGATPTNNTISAGAVTAVAGIRVDCTITNDDVAPPPSQITRTQGFWSTHRSITTAAWFGGSVGGNTFGGVADKSICDGAGARELDTIGKVLGGFWSNIAKTSTGAHRSDLDHARMQLAQQLLAAILNNAAFGSSPTGSISIGDARAAFCGTDVDAIKAAAEAMAEFNESGDDEAFTPGAPGNGRDAKDNANIVFWDTLP